VAAPIQSSGVRIVGPVEASDASGEPAADVPAESTGERLDAPQGFVTREDLGLGGTSGEPAPG
jgi:hypothetical protein